jgi:hypothetical protein
MVGYSKLCKICNCEERANVERMRQQGASLQQIVDYLAEHGVTISKPAVKRHFDVHFPVRDEVARRYAEQSEAVLQEAVEKRLSDLEMLDAMIERGYRMVALAEQHIKEAVTTEYPVLLKNGRPMLDAEYKPVMRKGVPAKQMVDLFNGSMAEVRQAIKLKAELLGDKDPDGTTTIVVGLPEGYEGDDDS